MTDTTGTTSPNPESESDPRHTADAGGLNGPGRPGPAQRLVVDRLIDGAWAILEVELGDTAAARSSPALSSPALSSPALSSPALSEATSESAPPQAPPAPTTLTLPLAWLPAGIQEGDVLRVSVERGPEGRGEDPDGSHAGAPGATLAGSKSDVATAAAGSTIRLTLDPVARRERLARMQALRAAIPRGPSGDLAL